MSLEKAKKIVERITELCKEGGEIRLMEVCGTHTVSLFRSGVKSLLGDSLRLISGPGCPVCVTSQGYIDAVCEVATRPGITICTYGDMIRVPGRVGSLEQQRARGAQVKIVYSARDVVRLAREHPQSKVIFLAVGFETTAPATAATIIEAEQKKLDNFFVIVDHKLVIPAMLAILSTGDVRIDGFLCPGHVSVVIGSRAYLPIVQNYNKPCVVAGFEPDQMLMGICHLVEQVTKGEAKLENVYSVAVADQGNVSARACMEKVFEPAPAVWRAMGTIPDSGLALREPYKRFDALAEFDIQVGPDYEPPGCRCGEVIQGKAEPADCSLFGQECLPSQPIGPCMVSSEGTCAAWYKYGGYTNARSKGPVDTKKKVSPR